MSADLVESVRRAIPVEGTIAAALEADAARRDIDLPAILAALTEAESLRAQLAASQAREVALREALATIKRDVALHASEDDSVCECATCKCWDIALLALSAPTDGKQPETWDGDEHEIARLARVSATARAEGRAAAYEEMDDTDAVAIATARAEGFAAGVAAERKFVLAGLNACARFEIDGGCDGESSHCRAGMEQSADGEYITLADATTAAIRAGEVRG